MPKTHEAIARARSLLDALDQQLTAASDAEADEARERVAVLSFGLTALLEQLGAHAPANDVAPAPVGRPALSFGEEYPAGPGRRLMVARFCARWFVIEGFMSAPLDTYRVDERWGGPYDRAYEARGVAMRMSKHYTGIDLLAARAEA